VATLTDRFQTLEAITPQAVRQWVDELAKRTNGASSASSLRRMVSCWRSYWRFLEGIDAVPAGSNPFALVKLPKKGAGRTAGKGAGLRFRLQTCRS
jgi:site-specific recombinase XerD